VGPEMDGGNQLSALGAHPIADDQGSGFGKDGRVWKALPILLAD